MPYEVNKNLMFNDKEFLNFLLIRKTILCIYLLFKIKDLIKIRKALLSFRASHPHNSVIQLLKKNERNKAYFHHSKSRVTRVLNENYPKVYKPPTAPCVVPAYRTLDFTSIGISAVME